MGFSCPLKPCKQQRNSRSVAWPSGLTSKKIWGPKPMLFHQSTVIILIPPEWQLIVGLGYSPFSLKNHSVAVRNFGKSDLSCFTSGYLTNRFLPDKVWVQGQDDVKNKTQSSLFGYKALFWIDIHILLF